MKHLVHFTLALVFTGVGVGVGAVLWHGAADTRSAGKLASLCATVKTTLRRDAAEIRGNAPTKEMLKARVYSYHVGDGVETLAACLPEPFPIERWNDCLNRGDDPCLAAVLDQAADRVR